MKIVLVTSGSRGDVQPYILLGLELQRRGHDVDVATEERMHDLVKQLGPKLGFHRVSGDPTAMLFDKKCQASIDRFMCRANAQQHGVLTRRLPLHMDST